MQKYKNAVPLFDIDLTLLAKTGSRGSSFEYAIKKVLGVDVSIKNVTTDGMIDPEIFIELLKSQDYEHINITQKQRALLISEMENHFFKNLSTDIAYEPMPGVRNLLQSLFDENYLIGILTGNTEKVGKFKLRQANLDSFFTFGFFGDTANKRAELSKQAKEKVLEYFPKEAKPRLVIIGDAPKDIFAAHEVGLSAIGIGTGKYSIKELAEAGADGVLESLEDQKAFISLLEKV